MESRHNSFGRERILAAPGPTQVPLTFWRCLGARCFTTGRRNSGLPCAVSAQDSSRSRKARILCFYWHVPGTAAMESAVINVADPADKVAGRLGGVLRRTVGRTRQSLRMQRRTLAVRVGTGAVAG